MRNTFVLAAAVAAVALLAPAQQQQQRRPNYPPDIPDAKVETYKKVGGVDLKLWIIAPDGHSASDRSPAIVFFFGGGWRSGTPTQFLRQARYLASRGMVAALADYRVESRQGVKANKCVADAKSAIRWLRANAARLGVDPERIAAGGGSAGGHLAAAAATLPGHDNPRDDLSVSAVPNALALFNPAVVLASVPGMRELDAKRISELEERMGAKPESMSPYHHVKAVLPPTIIFHGKNDTTVPYVTVEMFAGKMKRAGNRCELFGYEGQAHGFFNYGRGDGKAYYDTLRRLDGFFSSLGWIEGEPTLSSTE